MNDIELVVGQEYELLDMFRMSTYPGEFVGVANVYVGDSETMGQVLIFKRNGRFCRGDLEISIGIRTSYNPTPRIQINIVAKGWADSIEDMGETLAPKTYKFKEFA
jgi:hypothetical protein